ncbi:Dyp-type peroxidase [Angustibacter sp. McL0619]|uniref:Dyp-type peroxidase n=1 Tax=Angustibacter sp. McL0619 TaxID=3415676 RepID=UPI003CE72807
MTATEAESLDLEDIQGLLVRGYPNLPEAVFVLFAVQDRRAAGNLLARWAQQVTPASSRPDDVATHLALTTQGIQVLAGSVSGFSQQFTSGMATEYRSRLLGDVQDDDPRTWRWGGPGTPEVHLLLMLYAASAAGLQSLRDTAVARAQAGGLAVVAQLDTHTLGEREPFGFHDGISQPVVAGLPLAQGATDVVRAGEFVLGYRNEYGQRSERPLLPAEQDPHRLLPRDADGSGSADLGRNGSYLVLRELEQDVDGFRDYLDRATRDEAGRSDPSAAERLAAKIVGRWPSGAPLVLDPDHDNPDHGDRNDFGYQATDPDGLACPIGAHVRRANPRDSLDPRPGTPASIQINHRHRILRRGRGFRSEDPDGTVRTGLYFLCFNANLARQFEFIQHSWLGDPGFNLLDDATDPLVGVRHGGGATFSVQAVPLRRRYRDLPQFVHVRGGSYFFLPGLGALRFLAELAGRPVGDPR